MRSRTASTDSAEQAHSFPPATPPKDPQSSPNHEDPLAFSSPPGSPFAELSPTQTLAAESPELPPLPPFPAVSRGHQTPLGKPEAVQSSGRSSYYTASWGSPYQQIPAGFKDASQARKASITAGSDDVEDVSPGRFNLGHLIPTRLPTYHGTTPTRPSTPTKDFKSVRDALLDAQTRLDPHLVRERSHSVSEASDTEDEREDTEWDLSNALLQATPSATRPQPLQRASDLSEREPKPYRAHMSNRTVTQDDIWEALGRSRKVAGPAVDMQNSKYAVADVTTSEPPDAADAVPTTEEERQTEVQSGTPQDAVADEKAKISAVTADTFDVVPTPATEAPEPAPLPVRAVRERKKLIANGKACWISLPPDVPRTARGALLKPLTPDEIAKRLGDFEKAGYDTRGFSHWSGAVGAYDGNTRVQNRPVFPEAADLPSAGSRPAVKIPNKKSWDDYMNQLTELKLAALGVSFGGDPAPPSSAPLSRQSSSQYPTSTFSPPPLSSSAASHQQVPGFPPGFVPGHASRQSMASPISSTGNPRQMGHMHRQSMFASPPGFPQQPTPPGLSRFSPNHFSRQSIAGGFNASSPVFPTSSAAAPLSAGGTKSPVSPFQFPATQGFPFNAREDLLVQMQRQQQQLHAQQQMQAQAQIPGLRPVSVPPNLQEVPEAEEEDEVPVQQANSQLPEIANPRPRHSKNVSMQLERDAEKTGYQFENLMAKDFAAGPERDTKATLEAKSVKLETPAKQAPEPLLPAKAADTSDGTPSSKTEGTLDLMTSPTSDSFTSGHVSKASSVSKFNVEAKEFKFNPSASFNPGAFSPNNFAFQSSKTDLFSPPLNGLGANFRPAVPEFNPSASTGSNSSLFGNRDFSFSTSFNPGASTFQPGSSVMSETDSGADSGNRIFSNIKFGDIIKPTKKSKAIPIVKPEDVALPMDDTGDDEPQEDESGRLAQADGRQKRARQGRDDGDDVPRFAFPSHPLDDEKTPEPETVNKALEKEGSATPTLKQAVPHRIFSRNTEASRFEDSGFQDGPDDNASSLFQQLSSAVTDGKPKPTHERKKSSLSAAAKPFEFNKPWKMTSPQAEQPESEDDVEPEDLQQGEVIVDFAQQIKEQILPASSPIVNISDQEDGESADAVAHAGRKSAEDVEDTEFDAQPDFDNIDEIMKQLNAEGSDVGIERTEPSWQQQSSSRPATATTFDTPDLKPSQMLRSDAPSPSPRRALHHVQAQERDVAEESPVNPFGDQAAEAYESQSQPLHQRREVPASDWDDDDLSAEADVKVRARGSFFDEHVNTILQRAIASKLEPLEQRLSGIQLSISMMSEHNLSRRELRRAREREDSDADDEDETEEIEGSPMRSRSVPPNRRLEQIKSVVRDALVTHSRGKTSPKDDLPTIDPDEFYQAIADVKASAAFFASKSLQLDEVKELVEDALERQRVETIDKDTSNNAPSQDSQYIAELARSLAEANTRADQASEARKMAEAGETRLAKELALAEEELALLKEDGEDDENVHRRFEKERDDLKDQIEALEQIKLAQHDKLALLSDQNAALEATISEHRASHDALRRDVHNAHQERLKLQSTLDAMQYRAEEAMRVRSSMRDRLADLREEMRQAAHFNTQREAKWHHEDQEHRKRYEVLTARIGAEARTRERLEQEMERLENRERDAMRLRIALDESQNANDKLEEQIGDLNLEIAEQRKEAERYARQFREARDEGRNEVQRVTILMRAELEASTSKADIVRADLEAEVVRLQTQLEHVGIEAETAKERHELMLQHEADARRDALREQQESHHRALQEQAAIYEQRMEELRQQHSRALDIALEERNMAEARLMDDHKRSISRAIEDKERSEMLLNDRLVLSDAKFEHLQDKVLHLEEKLAVAKDAAQAAVQAARTAKVPSSSDQSAFALSATDSADVRMPEKISPQALRESIAVLQEQLQAREARIEELEAELEPIRDAPAQVKHRETEVTWLREILDVRQADLTDLINALAQPTFNREAVKNAAIRIRANLQMELQEKDRLLKGGAPQASVASQVGPALASISNFASPKAAQLAAAIGNWRKGSVATPSGLRQASRAEESAPPSRTQTPSKPSSNAQSFLSGLMTPPQSNLRRTPSPALDARELSEGIRRASEASSAAPGPSSRALSRVPKTRSAEKEPAARGVSPPPRLETPPLLTNQWEYDDDAEQTVADLDVGAEGQAQGGAEDATPEEADDETVPFETFD